MKVYLAAVNYQYGRNAFLPYAVGRLWAYALTKKTISENFDLGGFLWRRDPVKEVAARMDNPAVLGLSSYIWNWEYNKALAKAVRKKWPKCWIVVGGPEVPKGKPVRWADCAITGEGEVAFAEALMQISNGLCPPRVITADRTADLSQLPSPYLTGLFDNLMGEDVDWHASQETMRGCPYSCTFCDWGSAVYTKVRRFPADMIMAEVDWMARQKIDLLYNADSNYGMLKEDRKYTAHIIRNKRKYGFPKTIRAAYAKKTTDNVFQIARALDKADILKGVTLSMQSTNADTLTAIKRSNIPFKDYEGAIEKYKDWNIPTYTELILGLPGETRDTFMDGIDRLLNAGQHDGLAVFPLIALKNSELGDPAYRKEWKIKTKRIPMLLSHGSPGDDPYPEMYDIVQSTSTMSRDDWRDCYMFAIIVEALHTMGFMQETAHVAKHKYQISYREFYEGILSNFKNDKMLSTPLFEELSRIEAKIKRLDLNTVIKPFGNVTWHLSESLWLNLWLRRGEMKQEIEDSFHPHAHPIMKQLNAVLYSEINLLPDPSKEKRYVDYQDDTAYVVEQPGNPPYNDLADWARDLVWYGRKGKPLTSEIIKTEFVHEGGTA